MTVPHSGSTRRTSLLQFLAALMGGGVIAGGAIAVFESQGLRLPPTIAGLAAIGVGGAVMLWSRGWWARVDEGVREAHKTSWYWGGSLGMVLVGALAAMLLVDRSGQALNRFAAVPGDGGLILTGMLITVGLQLACYGLFWAGWWFTRSR